jgi:hypothetical protein
VIPILGARKLWQFQENLNSLTLNLSPEQLRTLDQSSRLPLGFPHDFYQHEMVRSLIFGGMRDRILA